MDRQFSFSDAKKLLKEHQETQNKLNEIKRAGDIYKEAVKRAADSCMAAETLKLMKDIPIEEVNRNKNGIRVKALRDSGYTTYADIYAASAKQLSFIKGISEDGAKAVKRVVNDASDTAKKTVKLKLNADNKTENMTGLVLAVSQFQKAAKLSEESEMLSRKYSYDMQCAMNDIQTSTGLFRWMFSSKEKKQRAVGAYRFLDENMRGEYGNEAQKLSEELKNTIMLPPNAAWELFKEQPIQYSNILEGIVPGVFGNGDEVYGLPEELAAEIKEADFHPEGINCNLRRYQEWGVRYILHQGRVLLGDEMGLGKTVQAIAAMVSLKNTGATHFVVVCPASVLINWCREIQKFSDLKTVKVHGDDRAASLEEWLKTGGVAVTTYETTAVFKMPDDFGYTMLVVDEAHYIKNPDANRTANTKEIAKKADRILFMTGTALENNVDEMVNLIQILKPDIAKEISGMKMLASAPQFREKVAPVYYRRKREDVLTELPELLETKEWCVLGSLEEREYENAVLSKNYNAARRVSWHVDDMNESGKAKRMLEIIEEAKSEDRKIIVFSFFLDTIQKVARMLGDSCSEPINGSVSPARRQEIIDEFNKAPAGQVLAAQIIAGGTGLNIQAASVVILCEPQLKPSIENQAISRAYRMGQARNVLVYRLLADDTIDEKITNLLAEKQTIFDAFADKSAAAESTEADVEIDAASLGNIIQEEIDRINAKKGTANTAVYTEPAYAVNFADSKETK